MGGVWRYFRFFGGGSIVFGGGVGYLFIVLFIWGKVILSFYLFWGMY